jgi:hypothetical protein
VPSGRARQNTGRGPGSISCFTWQVTHASVARALPGGTSRRLVEPQRVQVHSAVVTIVTRA